MITGRSVAFVTLAAIGAFVLPSRPGTATVTVGQVRTRHSITVGTLTRSWLEIAPHSAAASTVPIIVVLSGINATASQEISRDDLVPLVTADKAELIYPTPIDESWNASGGCCGEAGTEDIDDVGFLEQLVASVDPARSRPIDLVGFSNGGRLGYLVGCDDPALFDETAIVLAVPMPGCEPTEPLTLLQVDGTDDSYVPYSPGQQGEESPPATTQAGLMRANDGCTVTPSIVKRGTLVLDTWEHCRSRTRFEFATYVGGQHLWPTGFGRTPSGATLIWSFFTNSALG